MWKTKTTCPVNIRLVAETTDIRNFSEANVRFEVKTSEMATPLSRAFNSCFRVREVPKTIQCARDEHGSGLDRTGSGLKPIFADSGLDRTAIFF